MKKIVLLSDSHSYIDDLILGNIIECDEVWHAGDIGTISVIERISEIKPLRAVYGNIDGNDIRRIFPKIDIFEREGNKILMTHAGGYPGKYLNEIKNIIKRELPFIVVCGHSHILKIIYDKEYRHLHLNPGAIGKYGFHVKRTLLRFDLSYNNVSNMEIIEYEK